MLNRVEGILSPEPAQKQESAPQVLKPDQANFMDKLSRVKSDEVRDHLQGLYGKISKQADKISERLYLDDVLHYKKLVREFLDVATKNSHQFSKQNFLDRRGRHRVYAIVKNVDRELDHLTKEFINQEADRISVMKRLDDIRGMLMDIMM
ncbi:YaaR family protein [Tindallia californiensis]|uniref:DUF327 domain-containing protein n=1 Tax=Tindallia californiensis TaxID=159292 RepID=A0A1H3L979_9FIRM|nr:YaaR family protein [Tindallia californiensis]SDY60880.1 hypothetical protein SAMN05192546_103116 [Tindallia californiensis]